MNLDAAREYALKKRGVTEGQPFGDDTLVYKVMDKIFMLMSIEVPVQVNLKCEPEHAIELRERYKSVIPGYHMNKTHWNTVILDNTIQTKEILKMVDDSYDLIVKAFPKKKMDEFLNL
jgi:predicted DNA-binding protein (MmcQ/YjbR family)